MALRLPMARTKRWATCGSVSRRCRRQHYRRELDLDTAIARVTYRMGGARYAREVFSSAPSQVLVVRLKCDQPGEISFTAALDREERAETRAVPAGLVMSGQLTDGKGGEGMRFIARLRLLNEGGLVTSTS